MNGNNQVAVDITGNVEGYRKASAEAVQIQQQTNAQMARNDAAWQAEFDRSQSARRRERAEKEAQLERKWLEAQKRRREELEKTAEVDEKAQKKSEEANERSIRAYSRLAAAAGAAAVAVAAFVTKQSVAAAAQAERSEARFDAMARLTGGTSGFSRAQLGDMVDDMASRTVHGDEEIRDAMSRLMSFRQVSGETFREAMTMASGLAEIFRMDLGSAVLMLGKAFEDPVQGLTALRRAGVDFGPVQEKLIKDMVEHGNQAGAVAILLEELRAKGLAKVSEEIYKEGGYTKAMSGAAKATNELFEAIGKTSVVKAPTVAFFDGVTKSAKSLRDVIESGTWVEQYLLLTGSIFNPGAAVAYLRGREPAVRPRADPNSPEARAAQRAAADARLDRDIENYNAANSPEAWEKWAKKNRGVAQQDWTDDDLRAAQRAAGKDLDRLELMEKERAKADEAYARFSTGGMDSGYDEVTGHSFVRFQEDVRTGELAFEQLRDTGRESFYEIQRVVEASGQQVSRSLARMALDGRMNFQDLASAAREFAEELLAIQLNKRLMGPMLNEGTSFLDNFFNPGQGYGASGTAAGTAMVPTGSGGFVPALHWGGIAGRGAPGYRRAHAGMFAGAPRFHEGGEVPAILRAGEEVLREDDPRHRKNGGGTAVTVNVINQTSTPVKAQASAPRMEGGRMVVDLLLSEARRDAGVRDQLRELVSPPQH